MDCFDRMKRWRELVPVRGKEAGDEKSYKKLLKYQPILL